MNRNRLNELLLNALEAEIGGVEIYATALRCAVNDELRKEWEEYREKTEHHVEILEKICSEMGGDAQKQTPGREVIRHTHVTSAIGAERAKNARTEML